MAGFLLAVAASRNQLPGPSPQRAAPIMFDSFRKSSAALLNAVIIGGRVGGSLARGCHAD